jgi:hypothetical protein
VSRLRRCWIGLWAPPSATFSYFTARLSRASALEAALSRAAKRCCRRRGPRGGTFQVDGPFQGACPMVRSTKSCGHSPHPFHSTNQEEYGQIRQRRFLVTCRNPTIVLDLVDEAFDQVTLLVEGLVVRNSLRSRAAGRNHGFGAAFCDSGAKPVGIIALVGKHVFAGKAADESLGLANVVDLAWSQDEADGIAESVDADIDLGAQAAARTPDRLIFAPPLWAPAACWCARTMVESMIRYSRSGSKPNAVKDASKRLSFPIAGRLNTLFHLPNCSARSRQGAPARTSHDTASTNKRFCRVGPCHLVCLE